jgi:hypothetical protein
MNVVINQACYLPWRGYFALIKLADVFIFYDDVQLPQGRSFQNRVQVKTGQGVRWLSVPVERAGKGRQMVNKARIKNEIDWRERHYGVMRNSLYACRHWEHCEPVLSEIFGHNWSALADLTINATLRIAGLLGLNREFCRSSSLGITGGKTERLVNICRRVGATKYISPLGSIQYLEHELFENAGIQVEYIAYDNRPYPQLFGKFEPYVTIFDLLANTGPFAADHIVASTTPWREMVYRRHFGGTKE